MLNRRPWAVVAAIAVALAVPAGASGRSRPGWHVVTLPRPAGGYSSAEPVIAAGRDGSLLVAAATANLGVPATLWRSRDGGARWSVLPRLDAAHTGDSDVAVGADGWLYALDLAYDDPPAQPANPTVLVYRSRDGEHWLGPASFPAPHGTDQPDRPWLVVDPRHPSHVAVFHSEGGGNVVLWRSVDHGATFTGPALVTGGPNGQAAIALSSRPLVDRNGRLLLVYETVTAAGLQQSLGVPLYEFPTTQLWLASSSDGGATWTNRSVLDTASLPPSQRGGILGHLLVTSAVDTKAVYVAYSLRAPGAVTTAVYLMASRDHGATWTAPRRVPSPMASNVMPALAVSGGRAFLSWYGSTAEDFRSSRARWFEMVATVTDPLSAHPRYDVVQLTSMPVHVGGIDSAGALATDPAKVDPSLGANWGLRDFQSITVDSHGRPHPVWAVDVGTPRTQTASLR